MDSRLSSSSNKVPLFPAYSLGPQNQEGKRDWLCNSSFIQSTLEEVNSQFLSHKNAEAPTESISPGPTKIEGKKKKRKYEKSSDVSFTNSKSASISCQLRKKTFIEETGLSLERAFRTDVQRDPDNLLFEGFERTKIANFRTHLKIPVGLSTKEFSLWSQSLPKDTSKAPLRYFKKKALKNVPSELLQVIQEPAEKVCLDYIPISSLSHQPERGEETFPNFIDTSLSWKMHETPTEDKYFSSELRHETIHYNKKLSEDPYNIEMWIEFVHFQDKMLVFENSDQCHVIEKKIAILDKALKHNPKDVRLNVLRLKLSQSIYNHNKLASMWEDLLFFNPNEAEVWQEYLLYSVSNLTTFNISNVLKLYSKCLQTLSKSHDSYSDIVLRMLGFFNQLCYILKSCGYTEKAVAAYQALVEFNLFCEVSTEKLKVSEKVACFEPFWDSGAQRVGERGALGWAATVQQKKIVSSLLSTDSDQNTLEDNILQEKLTLPQTWLEFERLRENHHWLPWRPNPDYNQTSDDVDDFDRTVSFDDISKFLFNIKDEEHKFLLVLSFATFLGFDSHRLGCSKRVTESPYHLGEYEMILNEVGKNGLIHNLINPFPSGNPLSEERYQFLDTVLSQVSEAFPLNRSVAFLSIKLKQYYTLEVKKEDATDLKKVVKKILKRKENRNCLILWLEYISIEWWTDQLSASKTFQALLALSLGNVPLKEVWYFAQAFVGLSMERSGAVSANEMLWMLSHVANKDKYVPFSNQPMKPTLVLKTVAEFKAHLEDEMIALTQSELCYCINPCIYSVINCAKCFAYFQYFAQGCAAALQVYENVVISLSSRFPQEHWGRYVLEQINLAQVEILNYDTWISTNSIKPLQTFLHTSVSRNPRNSQLLYSLVKLKSASSVISPTRRFLAQILRKIHKSHPLTWFFALVAEFAVCNSLLLQNGPKEESLREMMCHLGLNWRIRSLFEKMLQSDSCAHISILWRSYLKFEMMTQNVEKAKRVYLQALQNCGWSKELLMDIIEHFPNQLEEMLALMNEKQIRVRTPLEEVGMLTEQLKTEN